MSQESDLLIGRLLRNFILLTALEKTPPVFESTTNNIIRKFAKSLNKNQAETKAPPSGEVFISLTTDHLSALKNEVSIEKLERLTLEIVLCQNIQNFDAYMTQMLKKIFLKNKAILTISQSAVSMKDILKCQTIEEIIQQVAEKKIRSLGYEGLLDVMKYLNKSLGLDFNLESSSLSTACEMFQTRNITVHNEGYINEQYLQNVPNSILTFGMLYPLNLQYVENSCFILMNLAQELDKQIVSHFKLDIN